VKIADPSPLSDFDATWLGRATLAAYRCLRYQGTMTRSTLVLLVVVMVAVVVGVDVAFFRNHFWERLAVNIGIVLVFGAIYLRFRQGS